MKKFLECLIPNSTCNLNCSYCYISQQNRKSERVNFKYGPDRIGEALNKKRLGGISYISICSSGETLLPEEITSILYHVLKQGHFVNITTNGTITSRFREIVNNLPFEFLQRLHFSFSFHYLELLRTNNLDAFFQNIKLIKYASNSFLATKISFVNEIASLCEKVGADIQEVTKGMGQDKRIGEKFLKPGPGYAGSCFPKDVDGLIHLAIDNNVNLRILEAVTDANEFFQTLAVTKLKKHINNLNGKTVAVWGLSFKANTDDTRESSSLKVIEKLVQEGSRVKCYDPVVKEVLNNGIEVCKDKMETLNDSDALIIMTEWDEFKEADLGDIKKHLNVIIDSRNIFKRKKVEELGIKYEGIGR